MSTYVYITQIMRESIARKAKTSGGPLPVTSTPHCQTLVSNILSFLKSSCTLDTKNKCPDKG